MSSASESPSLLVRFCDSFLQERNIKWILALGMLILLSSSLLLVSMQWHQYTPVWKYLAFLGYTAATFGAGHWATHRLGLRRTGTILQGLTLLLLPALFLVQPWVSAPGSAISLLLSAATLGFSGVAAAVTFRHFLRATQPTFLACYLVLALAGALLPLVDALWAAPAALALWAVFTIGTIKVNRHVFWLTEENRAPRIFGFLPSALLGGQFLMLFWLHAAPHLELSWAGVACVLVAIPVLATGDAVARVFQQRTGDLVRPLPWAVLAPLGIGLILCAAGLCLAAVAVRPPGRPYALVVAAAGSAGLLALVARRTRKEAFVWAMLLCATVAYQFAPAFFKELIIELRDQGARALQEERLPFAFYGLTYLPLLLIVMTGGRWAAHARSELFAPVLRRYAIGLAMLLLALSVGHVKALFPVGLVLTFLFAAQTVLFRDRRLALLAIAAWTLSAYGLADFLRLVLGLALPGDAWLISMTVAQAGLFVAGRWLDPWLLHRGEGRADAALPGCRTLSLSVSLGLAGAWFVQFVQAPLAGPGLGAGLLTIFLLAQCLYWVRAELSALALLFAQAVLLGLVLMARPRFATLVELAACALCLQWLLSCLLDLAPGTRGQSAFGPALARLALGELAVGLIALYLPLLAFSLGGLTLFDNVGVMCCLLVLAWCFAAAWRHVHPGLTCLGALMLFGTVATLVQRTGVGADWLPSAWAATGLALLPLVATLRHRRLALTEDAGRRVRALEAPLDYISFGVLALVSAGTLLATPLALRVAGGLGLAGMLTLSIRRHPQIRIPSLVLLNWQLLALVVTVLAPPEFLVLDLHLHHLPPLLLPLALGSALSLYLWQRFALDLPSPWHELCLNQRVALRLLLGAALLLSLAAPSMTTLDVALAAPAFLLVIAAELSGACQTSDERRVWGAELLALAAVGYFAWHGVLVFHHGAGMFVVLGLGMLLWLVQALAARHEHYQVLVRPLLRTAYLMPLVATGIGVARHVHDTPAWIGANSLALLLAAAFYFWRSVEEGRKDFTLLAGLVLNIALALLWRELAWSDPQLFMIPIGISILALVQLLKLEIPATYHDPLRYLGALVILVSPTFHIATGWLHLFTLMVASVGVVLLAIGLRARALMYAGTAFLLADLVAMLVRGSIDNANVLWLAGLGLGSAVVALGAICERHREDLLARLRLLGETLRNWE